MSRTGSSHRRRFARIALAGAAVAGALAGAMVVVAFFSATTPRESNSFSAAAVDHLAITPTSSTIAAAGSQAYTVTARDVSNNSFGDVTTSTAFSISPDGSCTGSSCTATVSGAHTVTATYWGLSVTSSLTVNAASASKLVFTSQPSNSTGGVAFATQPVIHVEDQFGNTVASDTSQVSLSITAGTGATGATLTCAQAGNHMNAVAGVAAFTGCAIDKASAAAYTLSATDGSLTSAVSTPFTISVGPAAKVAITPAPTLVSASATTNVTLSLQLQDQGGNNATAGAGGVTLTLSTSSAKGFFAASSGASGTLGGTFNATFASGIGTATAFYGDELSGSPTITAKNGAATWGSTSITVTGAAAATVSITPTPSSATASSSTNIALALQLQDQFGNNTAATSTITLSLSSTSARSFFATTLGGTGTLGSGTSVAFTSGVGSATTYYGDETAGSPTITAKNGASTWGTTSVTVNAGAAAGIVLTDITTQPTPPISFSGCTGSVGSLACSSTGEANSSGNVLTANIALSDQFGNLVVNTSGSAKTIDLSASGNGGVNPTGTSVLTIPNNASTSSAQFTLTRDTGSKKTLTLTATLHGTTQTLTIVLAS